MATQTLLKSAPD